MRPPIITEWTAVPSSVWTSWLTGSLNGIQFDVVEVEEDDVGLVAGRDAADLLVEAERAGAAFGGGRQHLLGASSSAASPVPGPSTTNEASRIASYMF